MIVQILSNNFSVSPAKERKATVYFMERKAPQAEFFTTIIQSIQTRKRIRQLVLFLLFNRIFLIFVGVIAHILYRNKNSSILMLTPSLFKGILAPFGAADIEWYLNIAQNGYAHRPFTTDVPVNWAYFPLWPMLLRLIHQLQMDMLIGGILINCGFFVLAIVILYLLLRIDFEEDVAMNASIFMAIFPSSYFVLRPGPEALFAFLVVSSFLCARTGNWVIGSILGAFAALTRVQGVLLFLPLLLLCYKQFKRERTFNYTWLSICLIPTALIFYMLYVYSLSGRFLAVFQIQEAFDHRLGYPFQAVVHFFVNPQIVGYHSLDLVVISVTAILIALWIVIRLFKIGFVPLEYALFALLCVLVIASRSNTNATLRYMWPIFPIYLAMSLAAHQRPIIYSTIFYILSSLQVFYFTAFMTEHYWALT
jgi:hypothetical protein